MEQLVEDKILQKFHNQVPRIANLQVPTDLPVHGIEVAPRYKVAFDPQWQNYIWYDDDPHLYFSWFMSGLRLPMISCTTVIGAWEKPFDDRMAERCAKKDDYECNCLDKTGWDRMGIVERTLAIQRAWKQNSKQAADYGTFAHAVMEGVVLWENGTFDGHHVDHIYDLMCDRFNTYEHEIVRTMARNFIDTIITPLQAEEYQLISEPLIYDMNAFISINRERYER